MNAAYELVQETAFPHPEGKLSEKCASEQC